MDEVMSWAEIEETFNGEWVLIEDPEVTRYQEIIRGKVLFHSTERNAVHAKVRELNPLHPAIMYVGEFPKDLEFALSVAYADG